MKFLQMMRKLQRLSVVFCDTGNETDPLKIKNTKKQSLLNLT